MLVLLAACAGPAPAPPPVLRTDPGPVRSWFPALGPLTAAWWVEERLGGGDGPGPSDYRRSAVAQLAPEVAAELEALTEPGSAAAPSLPPALRPHAPGGPLRAGRGLDERLAPAGSVTRAWLDPAAGVVVLVSTTT